MKYRRQVQTRKAFRTIFFLFFGKWSENKNVLSKIVNKENKSRWIGCCFLARLRDYITTEKSRSLFFPFSSLLGENHRARLEVLCVINSLFILFSLEFSRRQIPALFRAFPPNHLNNSQSESISRLYTKTLLDSGEFLRKDFSSQTSVES